MEDSNSSYLDLKYKSYPIPQSHLESTRRYLEENGQLNPTDKEIRELYFLLMRDQIALNFMTNALERKRK